MVNFTKQIVKRYRIVYTPQQQREMWEVHYSFWHGCRACQFIPLRWNDNCECYQQVNPTFDMSYE